MSTGDTADGGRKVRVLIADDNDVVRDALAAVIAADDSLELVGAAADAAGAIELAARHRPGVALVDVKMPGGGAAAVAGIRRVCPDARVVALTAYADRATVLAMVSAGASGYLVKGATADHILEGIHETALGHGTLSGEIAAEVLGELAGKLEADQAQAMIRRAPLRRIQRVLEESRIHMEYQPIVNLSDGKVVGVEGLLRVDVEPRRAPDVWYAEAAAAGLQIDLEVASLKEALAQRHDLPPGIYLSLNVSPVSLLEPDVQALVASAADGNLVLEITEHAAVDDYLALTAALAPFRAKGGRVAVDDAGSGFASLRHILRLEPDIIKIDVSLARAIHLDPKRRALTAALITFAEEIGAAIVVEGVENPAELACLRSLGAAFGQGFYLGRPAPMGTLDLTVPVASLAGRTLSGPPLTGLREKLALIDLLRTAIDAGRAPTAELALAVALDGVCAHTGWPVGHAWLVGEDGALVSSGVWHLDDRPELAAFRRETEGLRFAPGVGLPGRVLESGESVLSPLLGPTIGGPRAEQACRAGLSASLAFPVAVGARVLGVLEFLCWEAALPDPFLVDVLASFGKQMATVLERQRARSAREQREFQLRQALQLASLGSWEWVPATGTAYLSAELVRILGADPSGGPVTLADLVERVHPEDRAAFTGAIEGAQKDRTIADLEYRIVRSDGAERVVHGRIGAVGNSSGTAVVVGTALDVTDRHQAEEELQQQSARLRQILDGLGEGVVVADREGNVVDANPAAVALLGPHTSGRPIGLPNGARAFLPDRVTPYPEERLPLNRALDGQPVDQEIMFIRPAGSPVEDAIWLSVTGRPLLDRDGAITGAVIVFADVSGHRLPPVGTEPKGMAHAR